ncbi:hypothetical protein KR067_011295 [Drosophila pandora]|nr:hypothetical protein KR067_011295 [Drosophila pandora]
MGQTSSHRQTHSSSGSHNNNNKEEPQLATNTQFGNRRTSTRKSTSSKHYPTLVVQPLRKDELSLLRDSLLRNGSIMRKNPERRPVTISELKPAGQVAAGGGGGALPVTAEEAAAGVAGSSSSTTQLMAFQLPVDRSAKTDDLAADSSDAGAAPKESRNEFYIVGDGYHRTDHCYYRSPNGDYHKLPSDSFHKMSEGCFVRMADGAFRRLEVPSKAQISRRSSKAEEIGGGGDVAGSAATNVKSQLMRFIKRSKSHTPATLAKLQKEKEEARAERKQRLSNAIHQKSLASGNATSAASSGGAAGSGGTVSSRNNKIVVTMIENGGLPIVATSKAERPKAKESTASSEKAKASRVCIGSDGRGIRAGTTLRLGRILGDLGE